MKLWRHHLAPLPSPPLLLLILFITTFTNGREIKQSPENREESLIDSFEEDDDIDKDVDDDNIEHKETPSASKPLVPQLWPNFTAPVEPNAEDVSCAEAHVKCAFRAGCGLALQNYALGCEDLVEGRTDKCGDQCKYSLIALMSTHEGQRLMKCNCSSDLTCTTSRLRLFSACHSQSVLHAARADTVVSCSAAQWICAADPACAAALGYYRTLCTAMFSGQRCSDRCANSARILRRQSRKLATCRCDGTEDFECEKVRANMERLCFQKENEIEDGKSEDKKKGSKSSSARTKAEQFLLLVSLLITALARCIYEDFESGFFGRNT